MGKRSRGRSRDRLSPSREPARLERLPGRRAHAVALMAFALVFVTLEVGSYTQKSAVWDEPIHLADGYASLAQHDYRIDPEHPPFLRMWAALPLLVLHASGFDLTDIDRTPPGTWARTLFSFCARYLYVVNDGDRVLYPARFMIVLLGVALGVLLFSWAREWLGFWPAVVALAFYTIEPNIAAHASLVTTDFGMACFMFGTLYFLWRTCRQPRALNVTALVVFFALAVTSKFSALILAPVVALLLLVATRRRSALTPAAAFWILTLLMLTAWLALWGVYGFRYAPSASGTWLYDFQSDPLVQTRVPDLARLVTWIDRHHLLPNVFSQGFLFGQAKAQVRSAFLMGTFSDQGWWYYFPVALLVKTPVAILLLAAGGLAVAAARWRRLGLVNVLFVVVPMAAYLASTMATHLNIGVRHILPIYPLALLLVAVSAKELMSARAKSGRVVIALLVAFGVMEFGRNYPDNLAFFNVLVGGPEHGSEYLVDSNLDWGQDLKPLKRWMDANGVSHINLGYFGTAYPPYYHIDCTYLPGSQYFDSGAQVQLPGYVALSVTLLNGVYVGEQERAFYRSFHYRTPVASIGHSILVYWVDRQWW